MKICTRCKRPIENGKLFCGDCGGLGMEMDEEPKKKLGMDMISDINMDMISDIDMDEESITEQEDSADNKLVDIEEWKKGSSIRSALDNPKIPRALMLLNIIGTIILIGVSVGLLISAINVLRNEILPEYIMLELAKPKFKKALDVFFLGSIILYVLFRFPHIKLYLLISKRNFCKRRLYYVQSEELKTETHEECLERLADLDEDFRSAYAYLLARDSGKFTKEVICSILTICGKVLELVFGYILIGAILDKLLVSSPSFSVSFFLTQPALWGLIACIVVDIFVPSSRDGDLVFAELDKAEAKKGRSKKK